MNVSVIEIIIKYGLILKIGIKNNAMPMIENIGTYRLSAFFMFNIATNSDIKRYIAHRIIVINIELPAIL